MWIIKTFGRTSGRRHPCAVSRFDFIRWGCQCVKSRGLSLGGCRSVLSGGLELEREVSQDTKRPADGSAVTGRSRRETDRDRRRETVVVRCDRHRVKAPLGGRRVQPRRDRPRGVHESAALVQPIRTRRVLRTAFLHRLTEKHDVSDAEFLVNGSGHLTAFVRHDLSGHLDYSKRNHIEKWFQTVSMRIDRFHSFWLGSQSGARRWPRRFRHYYNRDRPDQTLDGNTPAVEVKN